LKLKNAQTKYVKPKYMLLFNGKDCYWLSLPASIGVPKSQGIWQTPLIAVPSFIYISFLYLSCFRKCRECLFLPTWHYFQTTEIHRAASCNCL